jgi:hypothetical protein
MFDGVLMRTGAQLAAYWLLDLSAESTVGDGEEDEGLDSASSWSAVALPLRPFVDQRRGSANRNIDWMWLLPMRK